ncbi:MAG: hypothetical protein OHK0029_16830 [Armatimonadaceae bacterium]
MRNRLRCFLLLAAALALPLTASTEPLADSTVRTMGSAPAKPGIAAARTMMRGKIISQGTFKDRDGQPHSWYISGSHTLIWEDKPFVPVGGRFQAQSWSPRPTDADFAADVAALEVLKSKQITDIYVQPARGGLTSVPPAAIQRLVDYLEQEGFTYGLSLNDGPTEILAGYDVRPGKYRNIAPAEGGNIRFPVDTLTSALYFVVSDTGREVVTQGEATMVAEGARVTVPSLAGKYVVFLLPRKAFFTATTLGVPNLWSGFDNYRDSLLLLFRQVRFGKGLRFLVDPLPAEMDVTEEFESFVPTDPAFITEWSEWLARRYKSVDGLHRAWGLSDRPLRDFRDAASLIPLWGGGKGVEFFYSPVTGEKHRVATAQSVFWRDLQTFKAESVRRYMNDLAVILKKQVADVPVIYRFRQFSPLLTELPAQGGFDGIGIAAYANGTDLITRSAGFLYAHAAEAPRTMWLPVVGTADARKQNKVNPGYLSQNALHSSLDLLREIGARAFYVDGVRVVNPDEKLLNLSAVPDQLNWLASYSDVLRITGISGLERLPAALFYPRALGMETASLRPLSGGGWWLPSSRPGVAYDFGPSGKAYALSDPDGSVVYYLWNPNGKRKIKLKIPKAAQTPEAPVIRWSALGEGERKGDTLTLTIGPDPIRLENFPTIPVPVDAFKELKEETELLLKSLQTQDRINVGRLQLQLNGIQQRYNEASPILSIAEILRVYNEVQNMMRPYAWLEAESSVNHSFDSVLTRYGASSNRVLDVDARLPGAPPATAVYPVQVRSDGTFHVWLAASPGSSFAFSINNKPLLDQAFTPQQVGETFAEGTLVWYHYGVTTLPRGNHQIEVRANGAATLDTLLIVQGDFVPNGPSLPPVNPE